MSERIQFNRRAFLRTAGMTALAGAAGAGTSMSRAIPMAGVEPPDGVYDFDEIYDRTGTSCSHWDAQIKKYGREKIEVAMGVADMDFRCAPAITRALKARCEHENWGYGIPAESYTEAIVAWNKNRHGVEVDPASVRLSSGVHPALIAALRAFAPPETKVLMTTPIYGGFYFDLRQTLTVTADSLGNLKNGRYSINWDDLESQMLDVDTNALILCNPQNPTGNVWSKEDLLRLGRLCLQHRIVVLADEIHCDFVTKGHKYVPFASLPDKDVVDNSVTFKAISKTFSLAAMKSAYFFSTNPHYLEKVDHHHRADLNTLGIIANEAAYRGGAEWFDQLLPYIEGNHDFVVQYTREKMPLVSYTKAQGTYLAWLDISKLADKIDAAGKAEAASKTSERTVAPEEIVQQWLVDNAHVFVIPGSGFGTGGAGHMRMNLGTSRKLIQLAMDNMAAAMDKL
jgi:cystathionine beta-lyase